MRSLQMRKSGTFGLNSKWHSILHCDSVTWLIFTEIWTELARSVRKDLGLTVPEENSVNKYRVSQRKYTTLHKPCSTFNLDILRKYV